MSPSLGSLATPRGLPGSTPPQPTVTPQLPPTPEGPVTAIRELGVPPLRPEGGRRASSPSCGYTPTGSWSSRSCGKHVYMAGTHRMASKHDRARKLKTPVGSLGQTSDHHRGLVNLPAVPSASSALRIIPPLGGPLMPGPLCGRGCVLLECVQGT